MPRERWFNRADLFPLAAAVAGLCLSLIRMVAVVRHGPYVITSGLEEESLFAVWKWVHRIPVYQDPFAPPFAISYFNWVFYAVYGSVAGLAGQADEMLPLVTRLATFALAAAGIAVVYRILRTGAEALSGGKAAVFALLILLNPLTGYWVLTTRPDIGGLVCELLVVWMFAHGEESRRESWIWAAILPAYAGWGFKQTSVSAWIAVCACLWISGRRRVAGGVFAMVALLFAVTIVLGGPDYRYAVLLSQRNMGWDALQSVRLFLAALAKEPLFAAGLVFVWYEAIFRRPIRDFLVLASVVAVILALGAAGKQGASESYFFPAATLTSLALARNSSGRPRTLIALGCAAQFCGVLLILAGVQGRLFPEVESRFGDLKVSLTQIGKPALVTIGAGNLPWFQPIPPHLVVATTYDLDRRAGQQYQYGGIAGMLRSGRIAVVVCPKTAPCGEFDGVDLDHFAVVKEDPHWKYLSTWPSPAD